MTTTTAPAKTTITKAQLAKAVPAHGAPGKPADEIAATLGITVEQVFGLRDKGLIVVAATGTDDAELFTMAGKAARKQAAKAKADGPKVERAKSTVSKDGTQKCEACGETLPITKFPTKWYKGEVSRATTCRACYKANRKPRADKAEAPAQAKAQPKAKAPKGGNAAKEATLADLRAQAKAKGIKGYGKMNKAALVKALA